MPSTVLAGPIEFSPAEIAAIFAVLAAVFVAVTAPGWLLVGWAMGRRVRPGRSRWGARVGGALLGLGMSAVVFWGVLALLDALGMGGLVLAVLGAWLCCGGIALLLRPAGRVGADAGPPAAGQAEGWGR